MTEIDAVRLDGGLVRIRTALPDDLEALRALHAAASDRSLYLRFFNVNRSAADRYLATVVRPGGADRQALAAWVGSRIAGLAVFERLDGASAEVALLVADSDQGEGIGTLLLERLAHLARRHGIRRFVADVLNENAAVLEVIRELGYHTAFESDRSGVHLAIDLTVDERALAAVDARDRSADVASLRYVLAPRSVVVIGAGVRTKSVGHQVLRNLIAGGYTGSVYVVNAHRDQVLGVQSSKTVGELAAPPDLAVVAVPPDQVPAVLRSCGERGVHGVVLLTAGFAECGTRGSVRQKEMVAIVRRYGMRLIGPNCLGMLNTDPAVRLNVTLGSSFVKQGQFGLVTHSGAIGIAVLSAAERCGMGASQFVSVGNMADVGTTDLLLSWEDDPRTRVIALHLDSFPSPRKFARIARRVACGKPIIAIKAGRFATGQPAGESHSAAAAGADAVVDALFLQAGVVRVITMQEMLDAVRVLVDQPLPRGDRVAIVGNSGGPGVLAADAAESGGLTVTTLSVETEQLLRAQVPTAPSCRNPVDLGVTVPPGQFGAAMAVLLAATEVDAVLAVFTETSMSNPRTMMAGIAETASTATKPVICTEVGAAPNSVPLKGSTWSLPVFTFPEPAAAALAVARRYARIRGTPWDRILRPSGIKSGAARLILDRASGAAPGWLGAHDIAELLACYGLPVCRQRVVSEMGAAVDAAGALGYPVAMKPASEGTQKGEFGRVRSCLPDEAAVRRAFVELCAAGPGPRHVVLQPMVSPGMEMIIGGVQHAQFGPVVMLGAGGALLDIVADQTFRLAPLTVGEADDMIDRLRSAPRIDGHRGSPVVSRPALCDLVVRVGALLDDWSEVAEMDLNPVICVGDELTVVDARIRISGTLSRVDPLQRHLD